MSQITEKSLILVDGSSYLYRAYYALPSLHNSAGEPIGAIYGVLNMLRRLLQAYKPSHIAVVFDAKGKTFRDDLFVKYKEHRPPMPDDLRVQIEPLYQIITAMGLPLLVIPGVEADDVIGTLAIDAEISNHSVLIMTGDKDMTQLVTSKITIINTINNIEFGPQEVFKKYGVPPKLIIDLLALVGDTSDNIPGVPGIGKKTAQTLLMTFGGLDVLYNNLDNITKLSFRGAKTTAEKLKQYKKIAYLSYKLAKIKTDVTLNVTYADLKLFTPDINTLHQLFVRFEFKSWLADLKGSTWLASKKNLKVKVSSIAKLEVISPKTGYIIISDKDVLNDWLRRLKKVNVFAFNMQTDKLDIFSANVISLSFAIAPGNAAYLPIVHNDVDESTQLDRVSILASLKTLLEDEKILKVGQNLKFNMSVLARYGINLRGIAYDITLESYVLDSIGNHYDIASLANRYLTHQQFISFEEKIKKGKIKSTFNHSALIHKITSKAEEVDIILQLHLLMWPQLQQKSELLKLFNEIDIPLISVLSHIERTGVLIDSDILSIHSQELTKRLDKLQSQAYELAGERFNLSSPKQLQAILYKKQNLPVLKKTPGGVPSTNEEVLVKLALHYPLPKIILEYRGLAKLKTTYTDKLSLMINPLSGRIHTSYHQAITSTGRLSSSNPNLQNIPVRNHEGRRIRQAFITPEGYRIVAADYSQIELRVMAHLSKDPELLKAFAEVKDIHRATAAEIFGISLDKVANEQRRRAKVINFGLIYGMSAFGLARQLNIPNSEAQYYINRYFKRYPGVLDYMERTRRQASQQGYVTTLEGRRLYLPDILSSNYIRRKAAERAAINAPMQGTAADIIKRAMIKIDAWIQEQTQPLVHMIIQVHDELVFDVHESVLDVSTQRICQLMENSIKLTVPLKVDIGIGINWDEAH
ncbi:5'-3' exonuclease domain of DNA polymerase I [Serratia symbiotica str. 'Cinara cedri']|nr:5'-3' exonuclease domain of DNA polymerase I [Serratia symbiotica str. 'Cinara cedri']